MAFIVEQFIGDRGIQLSVEDVIRPFSFGTNWQKVRVGVLLACNGYASLPIGTVPKIGVCTGNAADLSNTCTDAVWMPAVAAGVQPLLTGSAPNQYYQAATNNTTYQRVNSTTTAVGNVVVTTNPSFSANPTLNRSMFAFDLTKGVVGANTISQGCVYMNGAQAAADVSRSTFLLAMENETTSVAGTTLVTSASTQLPTRFTKDWDSMFVGWNHSTPTLCVYEMCVVRFS